MDSPSRGAFILDAFTSRDVWNGHILQQMDEWSHFTANGWGVQNLTRGVQALSFQKNPEWFEESKPRIHLRGVDFPVALTKLSRRCISLLSHFNKSRSPSRDCGTLHSSIPESLICFITTLLNIESWHCYALSPSSSARGSLLLDTWYLSLGSFGASWPRLKELPAYLSFSIYLQFWRRVCFDGLTNKGNDGLRRSGVLKFSPAIQLSVWATKRLFGFE